MPNVCRKGEALPLLWRMPIVYRVAPNGYITVARPLGKCFAVMLGLWTAYHWRTEYRTIMWFSSRFSNGFLTLKYSLKTSQIWHFCFDRLRNWTDSFSTFKNLVILRVYIFLEGLFSHRTTLMWFSLSSYHGLCETIEQGKIFSTF